MEEAIANRLAAVAKNNSRQPGTQHERTMDKRIIEFIMKQTCTSICCAGENGNPYCFSCFYAFNPAVGLLYYKSSPDSYHSKLIQSSPEIAATILPDKLNRLMPKGIQLQGRVLELLHPMATNASTIYYKKYPIAMAIKGEVFTISLTQIKMTDNSLGIGKKILWNRNDENEIEIKGSDFLNNSCSSNEKQYK